MESPATDAGAYTTSASHPFTCNTCQVAFRSSDLQRTHMQSDWHRYNLKRRVASLPPLSSQVFAEKVLANQASAAATAARASFEKSCTACNKTYFSENGYLNHLQSSKHQAQIKKQQFRIAPKQDVETASVMSSTFSLGEPVETASSHGGIEDGGVDQVADDIQRTQLDEQSQDDSASVAPTASTTDENIQVPLNQCLFCNFVSEALDSNVTHMGKQHGMFIPEREYLEDLEGLIGYLYEKVTDIHECLYCGQMKHTTSGIQTHMRDRGHCMIKYETDDEMAEIGEFYDFSKSYPDWQDFQEAEDTDEEEEQEGGVKLGAARATKIVVENGDGDEEMADEDEDGWESDSTLSSVPTDEITSVPIDDHSHRYKQLDKHRHHSSQDTRPHRNTDGFHSHAHAPVRAVYHDDYELHLPSGRTAGHRSLNKYYRQNLRNYPTPDEIRERRMIEGRHDSDDEEEGARPGRPQRDRGRQLMSRANGGMGMVGVTDAKKREVDAVAKKQERKAQRAQNHYQAGNERKGNFQKHFRDHLLQ